MSDIDSSGSKQLSLICWALFLTFIAAPAGARVAKNVLMERTHHQVPETDFIYFYSFGRIFNTHSPSQFYNYELQNRIATEIHPLQHRNYAPNPHAPFIGILFRPLAHLSFPAAYLAWVLISIGLYAAGVTRLIGRFVPGDSHSRSLCFCLAFSFVPVLSAILSGQISTIGFLGGALAVSEEERGRPFLSGLALSLCLYKPTLLVLVVPMLLVSRRYKALAGLACGATVLVAMVTAVEGFGVWRAWLPPLLSFGRSATRTNGVRILSDYLDFASFSSTIPGGRSWPLGAILAVLAAGAAWNLLQGWRKAAHEGPQFSRLMWAATLTWTLVLNIYVPIYDSIFAVTGVIATAAALRESPQARLRQTYTLVWLAGFVMSWATLAVERSAGSHLLTVFFALLGSVQLFAMKSAARGSEMKIYASAALSAADPASIAN